MKQATSPISQEKWNEHKEEIFSLYYAEVSRTGILQHLAATHNFCPTPNQYEGQKKKWGLVKIVTKPEWRSIGQTIGKRKSEGKESEVIAHGTVVPPAKVRKAVKRAVKGPPLIARTSDGEPSGAANVIVRTPPATLALTGNEELVLNLPFSELQLLIDLYIDQLCNMNGPGRTSQPESFFWEMDRRIDDTELSFDSIFNDLGGHNMPTGEKSTSEHNSQDEIQQELRMRKVLGDCLSTAVSADPQKCMAEIISKLEGIVVERFPGDLSRNVERLFTASMAEKVFQLLRYAVHLASNNQLPESAIGLLLGWILDNNMFWAVELILSLKIATTEAFASMLLRFAVRLGELNIVQKLLIAGAISNATVYFSLIEHESQLRDIAIAQTLLGLRAEAGNDSRRDALGEESPWPAILQLLIDFGGNPNEINNSGDSLLSVAAENKHYEIVEILLRAGAAVDHVSPTYTITPLQAAARSGNIRMIKLFLSFKAHINAPSGFYFKSARIEAAEAENAPFFLSPLQFAVAMKKVQAISLLLDYGADANGFDASGVQFWDLQSAEDFEDEHDYFDYSLWGPGNQPVCGGQIIQSPLQYAAMFGDLKLAQLLLSKRAMLDEIGYNGTALQVACGQKGNVAMVHFLLSQGADTNIPANRYDGRTALQRAAMCGDSEIAQILVQAGADIHAQPASEHGRRGFTVLQAAVLCADIGLVKEFISRGADIEAGAAPNGLTCFQAAIERGDLPMLQYVLDRLVEVKGEINMRDGEEAIEEAVKLSHLSVVCRLLELGLDITKKADTMLSIAIAHKNTKMSGLLIEHITCKGIALGGTRSLMEAIRNHDIDQVRLLTRCGATLNGLETGQSPLQMASRLGNLTICNFLISNGAAVLGDPGTVALREAVRYKHIDIVRLLLSSGARADWEPFSPRRAERSPLADACIAPKPIGDEMLATLLDFGACINANGGSALYNAVRSGYLERVNILLTRGAQVQSCKCEGHRPCPAQLAADHGHFDIVQRLLEAGALLDSPAVGHIGTILQLAVKYTETNMVRFLIDKGADVNAPPAMRQGATALQQAASTGSLPTVVLLLNKGADVNAAPALIDGRTALETAAEHGRLDITTLLMRKDREPETFEGRRHKAARLATENGFPAVAKVLREFKE